MVMRISDSSIFIKIISHFGLFFHIKFIVEKLKHRLRCVAILTFHFFNEI